MSYNLKASDIKNGYPVIAVGYCAAQNLLAFENAIGYNRGGYGWNCDVYHVELSIGAAVQFVTGYRPVRATGDKNNYHAIVDKYDKQAAALRGRVGCYDETREAVHQLLIDCCKDCLALKRGGVSND